MEQIMPYQKTSSKPAIRDIKNEKALVDFETMFLEQLLREARESAEAFGSEENSEETRNVREMTDNLLARKMAEAGVLHLEKLLEKEKQWKT